MKQPKITKITPPYKAKRVGKITFNDLNPQPHERKTARFLASYGFDIEFIIPSNTPYSRNPDILMLGTVWEMKGPNSNNKDTIKKRSRKAIKQANGRAIFDLRNIESGASQAEAYILQLFINSRGMRRIMLIRKNGDLLDIIK